MVRTWRDFSTGQTLSGVCGAAGLVDREAGTVHARTAGDALNGRVRALRPIGFKQDALPGRGYLQRRQPSAHESGR